MRSSSSESRRNSRSSFTVLDVMDHLFLLSICVRMVSLSRRSSCQTHTTRQTLRNEDREKRYLVCRRTAKSYMDKGTKWGGASMVLERYTNGMTVELKMIIDTRLPKGQTPYISISHSSSRGSWSRIDVRSGGRGGNSLELAYIWEQVDAV